MTDEDPEARELSDEVHRVLADVLHHNQQAMLTRFVTVAEIVEQSGERALWLMNSDGLKKWETIGMLEYALHLERAGDDDS